MLTREDLLEVPTTGRLRIRPPRSLRTTKDGMNKRCMGPRKLRRHTRRAGTMRSIFEPRRSMIKKQRQTWHTKCNVLKRTDSVSTSSTSWLALIRSGFFCASSRRPVDKLSAWSHTNTISDHVHIHIHIHNLVSHLRPPLRERLWILLPAHPPLINTHPPSINNDPHHHPPHYLPLPLLLSPPTLPNHVPPPQHFRPLPRFPYLWLVDRNAARFSVPFHQRL
jgi:hypothetical protein